MPAPIEIESARSRPALDDVADVVSRVSPANRLSPDQLVHYLSANPGSRSWSRAAGRRRWERPRWRVPVVPATSTPWCGSCPSTAGTVSEVRSWRPLATTPADSAWSGSGAGSNATDMGSLRFAERNGLVESDREWISVLELTDAPSPMPPPPGVTVVSLAERPDLTRAAYDVHSECLPDMPSPTPLLPEPFHEWVSQTLEGPGALPAAAMVALADGAVIGQAALALEGDEGTAEHLLTCVRPDWRGRGVAGALKSAQIAWARQAGIRRLVTSNDAPNAAMLAVNQRLGYQVVSEGVLVEGPARLG